MAYNKKRPKGKSINDVSALRDIYYKKEYTPSSNFAFFVDRVSTPKQKMKGSPKVQQRDGIEYLRKTKLDVVEVFSLVETAYDYDDRKDFNEIIHKVKKSFKTLKKIMHLVFSHASRSSRNKLSTHDLRELVLKYGVVLHYFRDNLVLHKDSDADTWARWEKMHQQSEEENNERRRNTLDGMLIGYEEGFAQQVAPYGYRNTIVKKDTPGYAFEAPEITYAGRAFELVLTGNPLFKKELDAEFKGIIPNDKIISKVRLMALLRDPFYAGRFDKQGLMFKADPARQPAIISYEVWCRVQRVLDDWGKTKSSSQNFAYTGTIKCGGRLFDSDGNVTDQTCGGSISGEKKRGKSITWGCGCSKRPCSQRSGKYMRTIGSQRYFSHEKIEEMLSGLMGQVKLSEKELEWFKKKIEAIVHEESDFSKSKVARIQALITRKEGAINNLIKDRANRSISEAEYRESRKEIEEEVADLKIELKEKEEIKVKNDWIQEAIMEKITHLQETFKQAPDHTKNKMVKSFFERIVLRQGKLLSQMKCFMEST